MSKNNWLEQHLTRIENKVDVVVDTQSNLIRDVAVANEKHDRLYSRLETHTLEQCGNIDKHLTIMHKGLSLWGLLGSIAVVMGFVYLLLQLVKLR